MRFSRLRLTGFKSFVDPTDLIIGDGLTGVVGPNGCGKSNLLEALRWVMGENRPTAMRGGGMEDVIFAGAATRPARNFAEVTLHIDNVDRRAPAGFNDTDGLEVVRRITRDVGSAYKVNGKDARARDVTMLFADAATGAHSPALVRQGQISELINAKPKNRRRVLEDAAGIAGLYQRRHEAELKLNATETNLTRVDDTLDQMDAQLATLDRQAKQAARYRTIGEELRQAEGLLLYRRWHEADAARLAAEEAQRARIADAARAEKTAREAATAHEAADAALPPLREEEAIAAALLQRLVVQRDTLDADAKRAEGRIRALRGRIEQLTRDLDRESALNADAGDTIAALEDEARRLEAAAEGHDAALAEAADAASEAARVLGEREAALSEATEDAARLAARHQSAERLRDDCARALARAEAEAEKARTASAAARATLDRSGSLAAEAARAATAAKAQAEAAETALAKAETRRAEAQSREADARAERARAEGEAKALSAEVEALSRLMARDNAEAGQILDALTVAPGFEKALGAALGDDLRAPEVDAEGGSGWLTLPDEADAAALPDGAAPLAVQVTAPPALERRLAQIGVVDADEGPRLQARLRPGQRLVSRDGDLWRWDGFRAWAEDQSGTAALRLEQMNKLAAMRRDLDTAESALAGTRAAHETLAAALAKATEADRSARDARRTADAALTDAVRAESRAQADRDMAQGKLENLGLSLRRHEDEAANARAELAQAEQALAALDDLGAARALVDDVRLTVEAARMTMMTRRSAHDQLRREGEARAARAQTVTKELTGWRARLDTAATRARELSARRDEAEAELAQAEGAPARIAAERESLSDGIAKAERRKAAAADALSSAEGTLRAAIAAERDAERAASDAREARAASAARTEAAAEAVAAAADRIEEALDLTPAALLSRLGTTPDALPDADRLEAEVGRLKRARDALGAVNLRAEEDAKAVRDEREALAGEKADLQEAVATLRSGIASLNREGRERLLTAFEQVNSNFSMLFTHLFGGGEANLVMVESDDPLEAGLEIMCQPPGKKLSTLSLLSGGEQTLTALALIFAVFLANPAPICVLDEVDAPLDDANVTRFCDMLDEMCRRTETRFLIITHHAVTMARMDRLFGVTMQEQGVSQLVSVDLKRAETLVA